KVQCQLPRFLDLGSRRKPDFQSSCSFCRRSLWRLQGCGHSRLLQSTAERESYWLERTSSVPLSLLTKVNLRPTHFSLAQVCECPQEQRVVRGGCGGTVRDRAAVYRVVVENSANNDWGSRSYARSLSAERRERPRVRCVGRRT